jgi:hypothetical protein
VHNAPPPASSTSNYLPRATMFARDTPTKCGNLRSLAAGYVYLMLAFISSMFTSTGQPLTLIALP